MFVAYALLIDDDDELRSRVQALVTQAGLEIETAATWSEGLATFNALSPDLVIADYNLPGSDRGLRLLLEVSRLRPSVRLVLISAFLNETDAEAVEKLGLVHLVLRKVDPIATARTLIKEVAATAARANSSTDWVAYAQADRQARAVSQSDLERLDEYLRDHRLPAGTGGGA